METETEIDHSVGIEETIDKTLDLTIGDNHRIDVTKGEETIDAKIMVLEVTAEIEEEIE